MKKVINLLNEVVAMGFEREKAQWRKSKGLFAVLFRSKHRSIYHTKHSAKYFSATVLTKPAVCFTIDSTTVDGTQGGERNRQKIFEIMPDQTGQGAGGLAFCV